MSSFRHLLKRLQKKHYPTLRAFAAALEIDPSHLSRAMGSHGQPFDVRGCLRLASVTGAEPGEVLRAAGKADIAALIEGLYGTAQPTLNPEQRELLAAVDAIKDLVVRQSILHLARAAAGVTSGSSGGAGGQGPGGGSLLPPPKEPDQIMRERNLFRRVRAR